MFEDSEVKMPRRGRSFWFTAVFCVFAALFVFNIFRVNRPPTQTNETTRSFVQEHSEGQIALERSIVEGGDFLPFRVNFNYRSSIKGTFRVAGSEPRILFLILDDKNFESWRTGGEFTTFVSTGKVPSGTVSRVLEAGTYFIVFDNRGAEKRAVVDIDLKAQ
jgi:hypothetical protein